VVVVREVGETDEDDEDEPSKKRQRQESEPKGKGKATAPKTQTRKSPRNHPSTSRHKTNKHRPSGTVRSIPISTSSTPSPSLFDDIYAEAEFLLETEQPEEIWQALYPPVRGTYPSALANVVEEKMRERNMPRQYWDRTWNPDDKGSEASERDGGSKV
jgi:hypothetical protein